MVKLKKRKNQRLVVENIDKCITYVNSRIVSELNHREIYEINKKYRSCKKNEKELLQNKINQVKEDFKNKKESIVKEASVKFNVKEEKINQIINPEYESYED